MEKITMLGTGHAMTFRCFNTCFVYENENGKLLVDTGGGNGLISRLQEAGISAGDITEVFISHRHTDHMMGLPWLFRHAGGPGSKGMTLYLHEDVMRVAKGMVDLLFPDKKDSIMESVRFVPVSHGDTAEILGCKVKFLDLRSPNVPQFGFKMELLSGKTLAFNGDVPFVEENRGELQGVDYLLHEAFHLASDKQGPGGMPPMGGPGMPPMPGGPGGMPPMGGPGGKPGKMGHSTVKEAAGYAQSLSVRTLVLFHGTDNDYENRQRAYTAEAEKEFSGRIFVPYDLDVIELD